VAGPAPTVRLGTRVRRVVGRFAEVTCPPQVRTRQRAEQVIAEFELLLGVLRPGPRRALCAGFVIVDQRARFHAGSRGRRLTRLDDEAADAYVRTMLGRTGVIATLTKRLKGLLVMSYYQLPDVLEEIGYRPAEYIATVSRRRLESYGDQIRAGERAVLAGSPLASGPAASTQLASTDQGEPRSEPAPDEA
jgi:hypothetical protein